jgi:peroxin-7
LFDACWSEEHENQIVSAGGDGTVQLWDLGLANHTRGPLRVFKGHTKEVVSVHWNQTRGPPLFLSGSWDCGVNLWDPNSTVPISAFREHLGQVYGAVWSPRKPGVFASCSSDGTLKVWDARQRSSGQTFQAHHHEVLSCDWSKYNENLVVTGSVDKTVRGIDIRAGPGAPPLFSLGGHGYAVRRVKCSPHHPTMIASSR